jgi:hypothetical protein
VRPGHTGTGAGHTGGGGGLTPPGRGLGAWPPEDTRHALSAPSADRGVLRGGAGNRTRVLCRLVRASPCAVHCVSTRPHRSREQAGVTGPAAVNVPPWVRGRPAAVSLLADAGEPGRRRTRADRRHTRSGSEGDVALTCSLGAYWFAATLEVVSRLHLHASPGSTHRVETVHPLVDGSVLSGYPPAADGSLGLVGLALPSAWWSTPWSFPLADAMLVKRTNDWRRSG